MNNHKKTIGDLGEAYATDFLQKKGYAIIENNYYGGGGELDIIAEKNGCVYFVEVKTKLGTNYGAPIENITLSKRKQIQNAALDWLSKFGSDDSEQGFLFISILLNKKHEIKTIDLIEDFILY